MFISVDFQENFNLRHQHREGEAKLAAWYGTKIKENVDLHHAQLLHLYDQLRVTDTSLLE